MTTPPQTGPPGAPGQKPPGKLARWIKKNPALAAGGAAGAGLIGFLLLRRNAQNAPGDLATPADQATAADGTAAAPGIFGDGSGSDPFGTLDAQLQALTGQLAASTAANNPPPGHSQFSIYAEAKRILQESGTKTPTKKQIFTERQRIINQLRPPPRKPPKKRPVKMHPG
jgi:hypothetical protein